MTYRVLVDTGPLVAIFSASDQYHRRCVEQLQTLGTPRRSPDSWSDLRVPAFN